MHAKLKITKQDVVVVNQRSKSFLRAFCGLMARQWAQDNDTIKNVAGADIALDEGGFIFYCAAQGGYGLHHGHTAATAFAYQESDQRGVVIGSDSTAVDPDDFGLNTQIRSGEKTGTILYCGTGCHSWTMDTGADTASFKVLGIFHNVSGASIDVKEVGIYATGDTGSLTHPNSVNFCILRDVITTITLADTEFLKVEYTISIAA